MKRCINLLVGVTLLLLVAVPVHATEYVVGNDKVPVVAGDPGATYTGSEACMECHQEQYSDWLGSGHPYKLLTPEEARDIRPDMPLPEGYTWDDILYVIGGWGWKSRFIGKDGFIITKNRNGSPLEYGQYNWQDGSWSAYHSGDDKMYDCTNCHNTGSTYDRNHSDLPGMVGDWEERGIGCEACHGPGSEHIAKGGENGVAIVVDQTAELCGLCHVRGARDSPPPAAGGFIRHHEQYQELQQAGEMADLKCISCHDPHKGVHKGATNEVEGTGIKKPCEKCHDDVAVEFQGSTMQEEGVTCIDCHMPRASKSAIATGRYTGDLRTHIFRISTDAGAELIYTGDDGKDYASDHLSLDYVCLPCHEGKDKAWAADHAEGIHSYVKPVATTAPPETTSPQPTTAAPAPAKKGACGPTAVALLATLPVGLFEALRRKKE